jgi:hypothetical protein
LREGLLFGHGFGLEFTKDLLKLVSIGLLLGHVRLDFCKLISVSCLCIFELLDKLRYLFILFFERHLESCRLIIGRHETGFELLSLVSDLLLPGIQLFIYSLKLDFPQFALLVQSFELLQFLSDGLFVLDELKLLFVDVFVELLQQSSRLFIPGLVMEELF